MVVFLIGGAAYVLVELIWRGRSHVSMFLAGGTALALIAALIVRFRPGIVLSCIMGGLIITAVEFITGAIVNVWLRRGIWDYSAARHNLWGQICPQYALLWALMTLPAALALR